MLLDIICSFVWRNGMVMRQKENEFKRIKKPWPTKEAMEQVYEMKLWGNNNARFYSGSGSHQETIVKPYIESILVFLQSFKEYITVCDLGCGDFNVGEKLIKHTKKYVGVDIVAPLIAFNKEKFKASNLEFYCLDIAKDALPSGDCAIVRQVLQHLSNTEVQSVVHKLTRFKYIILTEHIPEGDFTPNKDIISGQGIRLKKQSGINLLMPPFNLNIQEEKHLLSVSLGEAKGVLLTTLYKVF
jgi:hypothetical protein